MEVPDKIYLFENPIDNTPDYRWLSERSCNDDIEYICTDAFIKKMSIWFNNNFMVHDEYGVISDSFDTKEEMFEDLKYYMKGE